MFNRITAITWKPFITRHSDRRRGAAAYLRQTVPAIIETLEDRALLAAQVVSPATTNINVASGRNFDLDLSYNVTNQLAQAPTGLQLRIHYDSQALTFSGQSDVLMQGFDHVQDRGEDVDDGNAFTDRVVSFLWFNETGGWPTGASLPASLLTASFTADALNTQTTINFTGVSAVGYDFVGTPVTVSIGGMSNDLVVDALGDVVDGNTSPGNVTLREAVAVANSMSGFDTITFSDSLAGEVIRLAGTQLELTADVHIAGIGADRLTISGENMSRIFDVADGVSAIISDVTLSGGSAEKVNDVFFSGSGAAIKSLGFLTLNRVSAMGNTSNEFGGAIFNGGLITINDSTIANNSARFGGGGIFSAGISPDPDLIRVGVVNITNSTISGNTTSGYGGAIGNSDQLIITNSTIFGNRANADDDDSGSAGGIDTFDGRNFVIHNSIVAGNFTGTANGGTPDDILSGSRVEATSSFNIIGVDAGLEVIANGSNNNQVGTVANPVDPGIGPLADNGGPTLTQALLEGSPAIDAGNNARAVDFLGSALQTDQRRGSFRRILDGTGDGTATVDIGAFEAAAVDSPAEADLSAIDEQLGFTREATEFFNFYGAGEKWLRAANRDWYFLLADGSLILWGGTPNNVSGTVVAMTSFEVYSNPALLYDAYQPNTGGDAAAIDQELGFTAETTSSFNYGGQNEKWLRAANGDWYFLLTNGSLVRWDGTRNMATGTTIANLGTSVYDDPSLLYNAHQVSGGGDAAMLDAEHGFTAETTSSFNYGGQNDKWLRAANGDWYFLLPNGALVRWDGTRNSASGETIANLGADVYNDPSLLFNAHQQQLETDPAIVDEQLGFKSETKSSFNCGGQNDKWLRAANGDWYFLLPDGSLVRWDGTRNAATGETVADLGTAVYDDPALLFNASGVARPGKTTLSGPTGTVMATPTIQWNAVSGATLYDLWVNNETTGDEQFIREQELTATAFTPGEALSDGTYRAWVRAGNSAGFGSWSNPIEFTVVSAGMGDGLVVDENSDDADGQFGAGRLSLREAVMLANDNSGPDLITFSSSLFGQTIVLSGSQLDLSDDVQIAGPGAGQLTIDADGASRVFRIEGSTTVEISGLTITGGRLENTDENGAGIENRGNLTLSRVHIAGNSTANLGGGIDNSESLTILNSTISGNTALDGGGLFSQSVSGTGSIVIANSTISGNTAIRHGGGISNLDDMTIVNSTITGNRADSNGDADGSGGGIDHFDGIRLLLHNTIVAGNVHGNSSGTPDDTSTGSNDIDAASSFNLIGVGADVSGISNGTNGNQVGTSGGPINPQLDALADNGGSTPTHALRSDSSAIDAGDNGRRLLPNGLTLAIDQRGFARIANGDNTGEATVDIGAYEFDAAEPATVADIDAELGFTSEDTASFDAFGKLEKWLRAANGDWYFLLPDGSLVHWDGTRNSTTGEIVASLEITVYDDPSLLYDASGV